MQIQKILVGIDARSLFEGDELQLNPANQHALNRALWLAELGGAELTLFAALRVEPLEAEDVLEDTLEATVLARAREALETLRKEAVERGVTARVRVVAGRAWQEIIREVLRSGQELVIVGTRGVSAAKRLLFGSTALRLLRQCPCPVWVTRPPAEAPPEQTTILVADDFSDIGMRALEIGITAAKVTGSRLLVLHAVEYPLVAGLYRSGMAEEELEAYRANCRREAEEELQRRLDKTDFASLQTGREAIITAGQADAVIMDTIEDYDVDLLVMGTIARGGIPGFLIGNTAERLFPQINCSVLAIKPDDFVSPIALESES